MSITTADILDARLLARRGAGGAVRLLMRRDVTLKVGARGRAGGGWGGGLTR